MRAAAHCYAPHTQVLPRAPIPALQTNLWRAVAAAVAAAPATGPFRRTERAAPCASATSPLLSVSCASSTALPAHLFIAPHLALLQPNIFNQSPHQSQHSALSPAPNQFQLFHQQKEPTLCVSCCTTQPNPSITLFFALRQLLSHSCPVVLAFIPLGNSAMPPTHLFTHIVLNAPTMLRTIVMMHA
eukprot:TRINITY_DN3454_c0_g1_i1.p1 TRINITY_DN3454_c0_g1~~TRINITY_DN3454_c0_g1_i1.p1  ORF type:complete len:199 (-),score=19.44 TRINITY_DN3454_c0_g1_i1:1589-2146(-)